MAFAMSLPRTKRVKYIEPDGKEVYQEEDRWTLVRAVHKQEEEEPVSADQEEGSEQPTHSTVSRRPEEALEKLQMARGEISMMLDLIEMLDTQQHMTISNVLPEPSTLQQLTRQRDLRLQTRGAQLKDTSQRVRKGLAGLEIHLELEDRYFNEVAQIARDWHVRPSSDFKLNPGIAPFFVDLRVRGADLPSEKEEHCRVDLGRNADGSLQVRDMDGMMVSSPSDIDHALKQQQESLLWAALTLRLTQEAQESSRSNAAQGFATELLHAVRHDPHPDFTELRALLLKSYLAGLQEKQKTGKFPSLLPPCNAWIRHTWYVRNLSRSLKQQSQALEAQGQKVSLQRIDVPGHGRSVIRADTGERSVHIVVREDTTEVRGVGTEAGGGSRWASAGLLASVGKQEVDTLLSRIMLV